MSVLCVKLHPQWGLLPGIMEQPVVRFNRAIWRRLQMLPELCFFFVFFLAAYLVWIVEVKHCVLVSHAKEQFPVCFSTVRNTTY